MPPSRVAAIDASASVSTTVGAATRDSVKALARDRSTVVKSAQRFTPPL